MRLGEESWRIAVKKISFGPEVIVDHVEEHHQPAQMRFVDQGFQVLGPPIAAVGRVPQDAVIAPAPAASEIRKRHQFKPGDSGLCEMIELVDHGTKTARARECAETGITGLEL